jgi:type IV pilus assembly protein PilY1
VDTDNNGIVNPDGSEVIEFAPANAGTLCPYLGSVKTSDGAGHNPKARNCGKSNPDGTAALAESKKIVNFVRGCEVAVCAEQLATRNRQRSVVVGQQSQTKIWKLGDIMNSTPALVGAPRERYDAIYGDRDYATFFQRYKDRRQMLYAGANDGMLHAFNAGFFKQDNSQIDEAGATVQVRFTTKPMQPSSSQPCSKLPCDGPQYDYRADAPPLGAELWGFVPQDLLPQLQWLTSAGYDHMYYVDLKPKITDARIFANDADHPGGWGTVLIGGFGLGGSCSNCERKGLPRTVTAGFGSGGATTRAFLSSYFVLDITNPEHDPTLLWVFRDQDLGLTTAAPAILRVNPASDAKTSSANERWYVLFGSGPSDFDGSAVNDTTKTPNIVQKSTLFAVDLKRGPTYATPLSDTDTDHTVRGHKCSANVPCLAAARDANDRVQIIHVQGAPGGLKDTPAFLGDVVTLDFNLDFRADVLYAGSVLCRGGTDSPCNGSNPKWKGAMWRVTTNGGDPDPDTWASPTTLLSTFSCSDGTATCGTKVGPILAAPTLAMDDDTNIWVYFGTGRHIASDDRLNVDGQDFFGVKDCTLNGGCALGSERHNLFDASNVVVCTVCAQPQTVSTDGTAYNTDFGTLVNNVQNMDGWFMSLPKPGERNLSRATLVGGTLFFTSYIPTTDVCGFLGDGFLYALFYKTGSAYKDPAIGSTSGSDGNTVVNKSISMGVGVPSQIAVQIGKQGTGDLGTSSNEGSVGGLTLFTQSSTGTLGQLAGQAALSPWSRILSWRDV